MIKRVINEQTIFYFTHEQVLTALKAAICDQVPSNIVFRSITISSGLHVDSGLTLCLQRDIKEHAP